MGSLKFFVNCLNLCLKIGAANSDMCACVYEQPCACKLLDYIESLQPDTKISNKYHKRRYKQSTFTPLGQTVSRLRCFKMQVISFQTRWEKSVKIIQIDVVTYIIEAFSDFMPVNWCTL